MVTPRRAWAGSVAGGHPWVCGGRSQRQPHGREGQRDQCDRGNGDPQQVVPGEDHQYRGRGNGEAAAGLRVVGGNFYPTWGEAGVGPGAES